MGGGCRDQLCDRNARDKVVNNQRLTPQMGVLRPQSDSRFESQTLSKEEIWGSFKKLPCDSPAAMDHVREGPNWRAEGEMGGTGTQRPPAHSCAHAFPAHPRGQGLAILERSGEPRYARGPAGNP